MPIHHLPANNDTVRVGFISRDFPDVLTIDSGDTVIAEAWSMLGNRGDASLDVETARQLRAADPARGPHSMTGPVHVRGAQPGQVLEVGIGEILLPDHGLNITPPGGGRGILADRFPDSHLIHFSLDTESMTTRLADKVTVPLKPFLGIMGVAPAAAGLFSSVEPGPFGGNIDCPDLVAGTTLFLPVWREGAGFYLGDVHAAQGCGEINQTAIETAARRAELTLTVLDGLALARPRAETPTHLITMGFSADELREAIAQAIGDMVDWAVTRYGLTEREAYCLCSIQADVQVTQVVNGVSGIHARMPKAIFDAEQ